LNNPKIRLIFFPLFKIAIYFVFLYSFFDWIFFIQLFEFVWDENIGIIMLPVILGWIPVLIWMRKNFRLIELNNSKDYFGYYLLATITIATITIPVQMFMRSATGKLTTLNNILEIDTLPKTKYYSLKQCVIQNRDIVFNTSSYLSGKGNRDLNYELYAAFPILKDSITGINSKCWLVDAYSKTIHNSLSDPEKKWVFKMFYEETLHKLNSIDFKKFTYLERLGNTSEKKKFDLLLQEKNMSSNDNTILISHANNFNRRNNENIFWILASLFLNVFIWLVILFFSRLKEGAEKSVWKAYFNP
jgi:rhomboid protease GluP